MDEGKSEQPQPDTSELSGNEFENHAKDLASETRKIGIGQLFGYSLPVEAGGEGVFGFELGPGFILGEEVKGNSQIKNSLGQVIPSSSARELVGDERYVDNPKQLWLVESYKPPVRRWQTQTGGFLRKRQVNHEEVLAFNGKHGENDWVKYTYYAPTMNMTGRGGDFVSMTVAVPPELSSKLDNAAKEDIYFPDRYFRAMFPGVIGQDVNISMKRRQTSRLLVVDRRNDPKNQGELKTYPQPIEY